MEYKLLILLELFQYAYVCILCIERKKIQFWKKSQCIGYLCLYSWSLWHFSQDC